MSVSRAVILLALSVHLGCGFKPATAAPAVFSNCGNFPPVVRDCLESLPWTATDLELNRCLQHDRTNYKADAAKLREQFKTCSGNPAPAEPAKRRWWNR